MKIIIALCLVLSSYSIGMRRSYKAPRGKGHATGNYNKNVVPKDNNIPFLGILEFYDTGFSSNCGYFSLLDKVKEEAELLNVKSAILYDIQEPNLFGSKCYRFKVKFYGDSIKEFVEGPVFTKKKIKIKKEKEKFKKQISY